MGVKNRRTKTVTHVFPALCVNESRSDQVVEDARTHEALMPSTRA
jgi:hypothetical protein